MFFIPLFSSNLTTNKFGHKIEYLRTVDSTNQEAKRMIDKNYIQSGNIIISDDLSMKSLKSSIKDSTIKTFKAGCNLALHCNGNLNEMKVVAENSPKLSSFVIKKTSQFYRIIS